MIQINKLLLQFPLKLAFVILTLAILSVFFLYRHYPTADQNFISINQSVRLQNNHANIELTFHDWKGRPIPNAYVTVFDNKTGASLYSYPILRTNQQGTANFEATSKKIDILVTTEPVYENTDPQLYFVTLFSLTTEKSFHQTHRINLYPVTIKLEHFNYPYTPLMKVETVAFNDQNYPYPDQQLGSNNSQDRKIFKFYASRGKYNFNLDTIDFDSKYGLNLGLAQKDIQISSQSININFDFDHMYTYNVALADANYGWIKLFAIETGDFQFQYYGKPIKIISNRPELYTKMIYLPSEKCTNYYYPKYKDGNQAEIIYNCDDTNIRYDLEPSKISPQTLYTISPPDSFNFPSTPPFYRYNITLKNTFGQGIQHQYIHKIWDLTIYPQITHDPFSPDWTISIPLDNWTNRYITQVIPPSQINNYRLTNNNFSIPPPYSNWQDLYDHRVDLLSSSTGYLTTWPSYPKYLPQLPKNLKSISSCNDLQNFSYPTDSQTILIDIKSSAVNNLDEDTAFSQCLLNFTTAHPNTTYILKNSFIFESFDTIKHSVFYHFYLILHQAPGNHVGVLADKFYDLFYGFQDFSVINPKNFMKITDNLDNFDQTLKTWLSDYQSVTPSPIVYASW
ncbi:hypothetical protein M1116_04365 [Patescibacteria group bacterium]|nr:hypothetical protein [Patescibacteria group bacterium]